jgi:transposase
MEKTFGSTRFIYNWALRMKIEAYQDDKKSLTAVDLCKKLTDLKKQEEYAWLNEVSSECLQQSIRNLDQAFTRFFRENIGRDLEVSNYTGVNWYIITSASDYTYLCEKKDLWQRRINGRRSRRG